MGEGENLSNNSAKRSELRRRRKKLHRALTEAGLSAGMIQIIALPQPDDTPDHHPALEMARELLQTHRNREIELPDDQLKHAEALVAGQRDPSKPEAGWFVFRPTERLQAESLAMRLCFVLQSATFQPNKQRHQADNTA